MADESSKKRKKKKRGTSLIFKACFHTKHDPSPSNAGKILASDDNLVYCDVSNNNVLEPETIKKSASSRGRVSRIFKAVLFDTAMKKKKCSKKSSRAVADSVTSSPGPDERSERIDDIINDKNENIDNMLNEETEKMDNICNENNTNVVKSIEENNSSNDSSNVSASSSKTMEPQVAATCDSSTNTDAQISTERKVMSRVNLMDKKPPLPSNPQPSVKPTPERDNKHVTLDKSTYRLYLFVLVGVVSFVVLWMAYGVVTSESPGGDSDLRTNVVVGSDEL